VANRGLQLSGSHLVDPILAALRQSGDITVGDNQPYDLDPAIDYSAPFHALRRGLPHLEVEFRQDEIADAHGQQRWAQRFALALTACGHLATHGYPRTA
jgi:predicted N-formylglutamate amidohydrolase